MSQISAKVLIYALECAIDDRLGFADAYRGIDDEMVKKGREDVKKFRLLMEKLFGSSDTWKERGIAQYCSGKRSISVAEIKEIIEKQALPQDGKHSA